VNTESGRESGWRYALVAILVFFLLGMDVLSLFVSTLLDGRSPSDLGISNKHWYATVGGLLCSITLWTISAALIVRWARRRGVFESLISMRTDRRVLLVSCLGVVILAAISWLESRGVSLSLVSEYRGFEHRYPGYGVLLTTFQYIYYLLESVMVVLILATWQRAGEIWTGMAKIPWGGIGLTLTWGLAHFASHPEGALTVVLTALVLGFIFVGIKRNAIVSLVVVWIVFIF